MWADFSMLNSKLFTADLCSSVEILMSWLMKFCTWHILPSELSWNISVPKEYEAMPLNKEKQKPTWLLLSTSRNSVPSVACVGWLVLLNLRCTSTEKEEWTNPGKWKALSAKPQQYCLSTFPSCFFFNHKTSQVYKMKSQIRIFS